MVNAALVAICSTYGRKSDPEIGLLTDRIIPRYEQVGLMKYFGGAAADQITGKGMIAELDRAA